MHKPPTVPLVQSEQVAPAAPQVATAVSDAAHTVPLQHVPLQSWVALHDVVQVCVV